MKSITINLYIKSDLSEEQLIIFYKALFKYGCEKVSVTVESFDESKF